MKILDLYCKAGGAAMGYSHGLQCEIVGVDIEPQPRYPFHFVQCDALTYLDRHGHEFDFIHASPPCQKNSVMTKGLWKDRLAFHPDLIDPTRDLLIKSGRPYTIENVPTAPLINPVVLCGSMFGLQVRRHRLFETSFPVLQPSCNHKAQGNVVAVYGHSGGSSKRDGLKFGGGGHMESRHANRLDDRRRTGRSHPPAYTKYISQFIPKG